MMKFLGVLLSFEALAVVLLIYGFLAVPLIVLVF